MKIKKVWFNKDGKILMKKDLKLRICWAEKPVILEIMLTCEDDEPAEAIYINYNELKKYMKGVSK